MLFVEETFSTKNTLNKAFIIFLKISIVNKHCNVQSRICGIIRTIFEKIIVTVPKSYKKQLILVL